MIRSKREDNKEKGITLMGKIKRWWNNNIIVDIENNIKREAILFGCNFNINRNNSDLVSIEDLIFNFNLKLDQIRQLQEEYLKSGIYSYEVKYTEAYLVLYLFTFNIVIGFRTKGKMIKGVRW